MNPPTEIRECIGYTRVSTDDQADDGISLAAQEDAIRAEAARRGWTVGSIVRDPGASGKSLNRLGLQVALAALKAGEAQALVCAKLDRLTRSVGDFAALLDRARSEGWALVAIDAPVDTSTAVGEMVSVGVANFAAFERRQASERTRAALARRKAEGVRLGRPRAVPGRVVARIKNLRSHGHSYAAIAHRLNDANVATAHGGERWHASTIRAIVQRD